MMEENQNKQTEAITAKAVPGLYIDPSATYSKSNGADWRVRISNSNSYPITLNNCFFQIRYTYNDMLSVLTGGEVSFRIGDNGMITIPSGETVILTGNIPLFYPTDTMDVRFSSSSPYNIYLYGPLTEV